MLFISLLLFFRIVNYSFYHPKAKFNTSKIKNTRQQQQHKLHITKQHITTASKNFVGRKKESIERGISNKSNTA